MSVFVLVSLVFLAISILQWLYVPKIGPNPFIGLRLGYTLSSKEVWEKANRRLGALFFLFSIVLLTISVFTTESNVWLFVSSILIGTILITGYMWKYSANLLEETGGNNETASESPIRPIVLGIKWNILPIISYLLLLLLVLSTYEYLPQNIAVHFSASGNPDNWQSREDFVLYFLGLGLLFPVLAELFLYAGRKYPMIVHSGRTGLDREDILRASVLSLSLANLLLTATYADIYFYSINGIHMPFWGLMIFSVAFIMLSPVFWISWKWFKKRRMRVKI